MKPNTSILRQLLIRILLTVCVFATPGRAWSQENSLDDWDDAFANQCVVDPHLSADERRVKEAADNLDTVADDLVGLYNSTARRMQILRDLRRQLRELEANQANAQRAMQLLREIEQLKSSIQRSLESARSWRRNLADAISSLQLAMRAYTKTCGKCPPQAAQVSATRRFLRGFLKNIKCGVASILFSVGASMAANAQTQNEDLSMCGVVGGDREEGLQCDLQDGRTLQCLAAGNNLADAIDQFDSARCTLYFGDPLQCIQCNGETQNRFQKCFDLQKKIDDLTDKIVDFC
jgi:hypothetical protein